MLLLTETRFLSLQILDHCHLNVVTICVAVLIGMRVLGTHHNFSGFDILLR